MVHQKWIEESKRKINVYIEERAIDLVNLASRKLGNTADINAFMPALEDTYLLFNEADVVYASAQHFLYPINMLLTRIFRNVLVRIICGES